MVSHVGVFAVGVQQCFGRIAVPGDDQVRRQPSWMTPPPGLERLRARLRDHRRGLDALRERIAERLNRSR
jgi:hypothetical protein